MVDFIHNNKDRYGVEAMYYDKINPLGQVA